MSLLSFRPGAGTDVNFIMIGRQLLQPAVRLLLLVLLPFLLLISRWPKRWSGVITLIAGWMICLFIIDVYWLVMPIVPEASLAEVTSYDQLQAMVASGEVDLGWSLSLIDFILPASMLCLLLAGTMFNLRKCSLVPVADPRLDESLAFENF